MATPKKPSLFRLICEETRDNIFNDLATMLYESGALTKKDITDKQLISIFSWASIRDEENESETILSRQKFREHYVEDLKKLGINYVFIENNLLNSSEEFYDLTLQCMRSLTCLGRGDGSPSKSFLNECEDFGYNLKEKVYATIRMYYTVSNLRYLYYSRKSPNYVRQDGDSFSMTKTTPL